MAFNITTWEQLSQVNTCLPLGHDTRCHFFFDPGYINLNHGSYGAPTKPTMSAMHFLQERMNAVPDRWFRYEYRAYFDRARKAVAAYIGAEEDDVAFVPNASHGVNSVLRSLNFVPGDKILTLNVAYGMVKRTIQYLIDSRNVVSVEVDVKFPFTDDVLLAQVEAVILKSQPIKIASISHITSVPAIILPVQKLVRLFKKHGILCLVDGAHAVGQIDVNVSEIDADFYVANGHKWMYVPKASAILHARKDVQPLLHPTVISWFYNVEKFPREHDMLGTLDYTAALTWPVAIEYRKKLGDQRIKDYMHTLAVEAAKKVGAIWGTNPFELCTEDQVGAMVNVLLPINDARIVDRLGERLLVKFNTYAPPFPFQNKLYVRLSAQIYNELSDFEYYADAVLEAIKELTLAEAKIHAYIPRTLSNSGEECD